jgi:outer membrane protein OmpA-like peptidoglycan-associated protein
MSSNHNSEEKGSKMGFYVFISLLLGIVLIWLLWLQFRHNFQGVKNTKTNTEVVVPSNNTSPENNDASNKTIELKLNNGATLNAFSNGIEDQVVKFLNSDEYKNATNEQLKEKWFNFDKIGFVFGTKNLTPESANQIKNLQEIFKAYPDVKVKIGAYSDKKGNDETNLKISQERAEVVKSAIGAAQITSAEGYGEKFATVDENASDEERAIDRKISIRFVKE